MFLRIAACACVLMAAPIARAQEAPILPIPTPVAPAPAQAAPPAPAPAAPATPSPEAIAAGQDFFRAVIFDSGGLTLIFDGLAARQMPGLRDSIRNSPLYRDARPTHRENLAAFMESLPDVVREEFEAILVDAGVRAAPRFAAHLSASELTALAAFMRTPAMQALWRAFFTAALSTTGRAPSEAFPDWSRELEGEAAAFVQSPAGRAFTREQEKLTAILNEEVMSGVAAAMPRLQQRVINGMCAALEDECPPEIRALAHQPI